MSPLSSVLPHLWAPRNNGTATPAVLPTFEFKPSVTAPPSSSIQSSRCRTKYSPTETSSSMGGIQTDSSPSSASTLWSAFTSSTTSADPAQQQNQEMPLGTKIGLGMMPVVIAILGLFVFFVFWWRRRKVRQARQSHTSIPPPVPEKDYSALLPPIESSRNGSKVLTMAAFSTHVNNNRYREAQVFGQPMDRGIRIVERDQESGQRIRSVTPPRSSRSGKSKKKSRSGPDSPIDGSSPFRLKRGDTVRRSLGSEISDLWPSPPPTAWVKRQDTANQRPLSRSDQDMGTPRLHRINSQSSRSRGDTGSAYRPPGGTYWPMI
ncbi:hypothetical protein DDE82_008370 [Stemphylium lycopersici]|nr:hypothetical protein DDE82_008370 [Stemphylium lycopersici]